MLNVSNKLSPRLARGFSLLSAYQKATTIFVVADFILPLILQTLGSAPFIYANICSNSDDILASSFPARCTVRRRRLTRQLRMALTMPHTPATASEPHKIRTGTKRFIPISSLHAWISPLVWLAYKKFIPRRNIFAKLFRNLR